MTLVEATANIDLDRRLVRGIEAGFILRDYKSRFNGCRVEARWEEYDRDDASDDYPDLADAGTFSARDPEGAPTSADCGLYLYLCFTQNDARDFLLPFLVNRPQGLGVEMRVTLLADAQMGHTEPDGLLGRVAKYTLHLSRPET
jgi:hypothetical protein